MATAAAATSPETAGRLGRGQLLFAGDANRTAGGDVFGHYLGIEPTAST